MQWKIRQIEGAHVECAPEKITDAIRMLSVQTAIQIENTDSNAHESDALQFGSNISMSTVFGGVQVSPGISSASGKAQVRSRPIQ